MELVPISDIEALAKKAAKNKDQDAMRDVISIIDEEQGEANDYALTVGQLRRKLEDKISNVDLEKVLSTEGGINVEYVMSLQWDSVSGKLYKAIDQWFKQFHYIYQSGYDLITKQPTVQVCMTKSDPIGPQIADIKTFIPYIKEQKSDVGNIMVKIVAIFECTLAEHGCYTIEIHGDKAIIVCTRYRIPEVSAGFSSIEDCLQFVQQNHYYKE